MDQVAVAFGLHILHRYETEGGAVHAVSCAGGGPAVPVEHMTQMCISDTAADLYARDRQAAVLQIHHGVGIQGTAERRPSAVAVVFVL